GSDSVAACRQILRDALQQPFLQIMANAGLNSEALLAQVQTAKPGFGIDVMKPGEGIVDIKKAGVIDPARVTKQAVQNAVSIASTAATMGALVVEIPESATPQMGGGMPGGMGF
ncbi:MAG: TCP-1/cpn60 chaperonin family protein, partial [Candidatus Saccharimonadales bacterium]